MSFTTKIPDDSIATFVVGLVNTHSARRVLAETRSSGKPSAHGHDRTDTLIRAVQNLLG
jgi:hypothetical protein